KGNVTGVTWNVLRRDVLRARRNAGQGVAAGFSYRQLECPATVPTGRGSCRRTSRSVAVGGALSRKRQEPRERSQELRGLIGNVLLRLLDEQVVGATFEFTLEGL